MGRRIGRDGAGASTLSYIDMISGGFGAAFFLFLIFVSFPINQASTPSSGSRFLDLWLEWRDEHASAYIEVKFLPAASTAVVSTTRQYSLNSRTIHRDASTGSLSYTGTAPRFWTGMAQAGFSDTGQGALTLEDTADTVKGQWLRFSDPCPGTYRIFVGSLSPGRLSDMLNASQQIRTVSARARVIVSDGEEVRYLPDTPPEALDLEFETGLGAQPRELSFDMPVVVAVPSTGAEASLLHCQD